MSTQYSKGGETSSGAQSQGTGRASAQANTGSTSTGQGGAQGTDASNLNWGSVRSDYGDEAYGRSLDEQGMGGAGYDDFSEGRERASGSTSQGRSYRKSLSGSSASRGYSLADTGSTGLTLLAGIITGAALMYFLDPDQGGRRRALLRDKFVGLSNDATDVLGKTSRDLRNRAQGVIAETTKALGLGQTASREEETGNTNAQGQSGASSQQTSSAAAGTR